MLECWNVVMSRPCAACVTGQGIFGSRLEGTAVGQSIDFEVETKVNIALAAEVVDHRSC